MVDDNGSKVGQGVIDKVLKKPNKTNVARVQATEVDDLNQVRGFIVKDRYPEPLSLRPLADSQEGKAYVCHCEDVDVPTLLAVVGDRKHISVDELKHTTRMGMGPCRGKRCVARAKQILRTHGIEVTGDSTPRAPLANQVTLGDVYNGNDCETFVFEHGSIIEKAETEVLVAGGGMAGSAAFRYFAEAGKRVILVNYDRGSTWRCIGGGRPAFSNPDISDIAMHNLEIFRDDQAHCNIDLKMTRYVNLVHDDATYRSLDASRAWSEARMIERKDFTNVISPYWNPDDHTYSHALISENCWQATPGRTIEYVRTVGKQHGGQVLEDCEVLHVQRVGDKFRVLVRRHEGHYVEYTCDHFVNAMGWGAEKFIDQLDLDTGLYPVKHQAFITRRLPMMGPNGGPLDMIIDRRHYKGFSAVYGQQWGHTGQIIGCASPDTDAYEARQNIKYNSKEFLEIVSEVFAEWIPNLREVGFLAVWAGRYTEPRYIVDPNVGLCTGLRGHGFMLGQYLAKLYVDKYLGRDVPSYMNDLAITGKGLSENAFK